MWKEVTITSIEASADAGGCIKGKVKQKLGNNNVWVA
jgi:hypothetical protein